MRIVRSLLRSGMRVITFSLVLSADVSAQAARLAVCQSASEPATPKNAPLMTKVIAQLGDSAAIGSLRSIRYTSALSMGTDANQVKIQTTLTRVYPDRLVLITRAPGQTESYIVASPAGAFVQIGGQKTNLPEEMRDALLKTVRLDAFYVSQNADSGRVTVTDTGTKRIGGIAAAVLSLNVDGAEATWYVGRADGRLLRTTEKVPVMGGMVDLVSDYSDWRSCDGLMVPFQRDITQGEKASQEEILTVELNPGMSVLPATGSVVDASSGEAHPSSVQVQSKPSPTVDLGAVPSSGQTPSPSLAQTQIQPKPFGFEMGMTREQIIKLVGQNAVQKDQDDALALTTAPTPHPDFDAYIVYISPAHGVLKVVATSTTISVNDEGDQLTTEFNRVLASLISKYGPPSRKFDYVNGDDTNKESQFWMMTLLQGERTLEASWNYTQDEPVGGGSTLTGISLQAKALGLNKGYVVVAYEFPGWNAYVDSRKAKQDSVF
jgi:hypothetical protein